MSPFSFGDVMVTQAKSAYSQAPLYSLETIDPSTFPPEYRDYMSYVVNRIVYGWIFDPHNKDRWDVSISWEALADLFPRSVSPTRVLKECVDYGLIEQMVDYSQQYHKSRRYNITDAYRNAHITQIEPNTEKFRKRWVKFRRQQEKDHDEHARSISRKCVGDHLKKWIERIEVDSVDVGALCRKYEAEIREKWGRRAKEKNGSSHKCVP